MLLEFSVGGRRFEDQIKVVETEGLICFADVVREPDFLREFDEWFDWAVAKHSRHRTQPDIEVIPRTMPIEWRTVEPVSKEFQDKLQEYICQLELQLAKYQDEKVTEALRESVKLLRSTSDRILHATKKVPPSGPHKAVEGFRRYATVLEKLLESG